MIKSASRLLKLESTSILYMFFFVFLSLLRPREDLGVFCSNEKGYLCVFWNSFFRCKSGVLSLFHKRVIFREEELNF